MKIRDYCVSDVILCILNPDNDSNCDVLNCFFILERVEYRQWDLL